MGAPVVGTAKERGLAIVGVRRVVHGLWDRAEVNRDSGTGRVVGQAVVSALIAIETANL